MRRWTHLHTLLAGGAAGAAATSHMFVLGLAVFALGVAAGRLWWVAVQAGRRAGALAAARTELELVRVKTERAKATELRTRTKHRRRGKAEQERELKRAYVKGATDQAAGFR